MSDETPSTVQPDEVRYADVPSDTGCVALMDVESVSDVWEDFAYHGDGHDHAHGGLMLLPGAVGTNMSWGGRFPVTIFYNPYGLVTGFELQLDPYEEEMPHYGFDHSSEAANGWTEDVHVYMGGDTALLGDPEFVDDADGSGDLIELTWPSANGSIAVSIYSENAIRKTMRVRWVEPVR